MKRLLSGLLVVAMLISMLPASVFAQEVEEDIAEPQAEAVVEELPAEEPEITPVEEPEDSPAEDVILPEELPEEVQESEEQELVVVEQPALLGAEDSGDFWSLQGGVLTISGSIGEIADYPGGDATPWHEDKAYINEIVIGEGVTKVGNYAFNGCYMATRVVLPSTLEYIGESAFCGCYINELFLPNGVKEIGRMAFACERLTEVTIPVGAQFVAPMAFGFKPDRTEVSGFTVYGHGDSIAKVYADAFAHITYVDLDAGSGDQNDNQNDSIGEGLSWSREDGVLTISGQGGMRDFSTDAPAPWASFADDITSVVVGSGVTYIGRSAFAGLHNAAAVSLPEGLQRIAPTAFSGCSDLAEIVLPESLEFIGTRAFLDCNSLTEVTVPTGVQVISDNALGMISNPDTTPGQPGSIPVSGFVIKSHGNSVAEDYAKKNGITYHDLDSNTEQNTSGEFGENLAWELVDEGVLTISGTGEMPDYPNFDVPWLHCADKITAVVVSDGVTSVGSYAFSGFSVLENVTLTGSVRSIGSYAFESCTSLTGVTLNEGLQTIGECAFCDCRNLEEITIPSTVTSIETGALASTSAPGGLGYIISFKLKADHNSAAKNYAETNELQYVELGAGSDGRDDPGEDQNGSFGDGFTWSREGGVLTISGQGGMPGFSAETPAPWAAFADDITSIVVGSGITHIGQYAFSGLYNAVAVSLHEGLLLIAPNAFYGCAALTGIVLPDSLKNISAFAFFACESLTEVTVPAGVDFIGTNALGMISNPDTTPGQPGIISVSNFVIKADHNSAAKNYAEANSLQYVELGAPDAEVVGEGTISGNLKWQYYSDGALHIVGTGAMPNYKYENHETAPWDAYRYTATAIVIEEGVSAVGSFCFYFFDKVRTVSLPSTLTAIGELAFINNSELTSVEIPAGVKVLSASAFQNCVKLTSVILHEGLETIGLLAFNECSSLKSITIPNSVSKIDYEALGAYSFWDGVSQYSETRYYEDFVIYANHNRVAKLYAVENGVQYHELGEPGDEVIEEGSLTKTMYWKLMDDGKLVISGTGAMPDYRFDVFDTYRNCPFAPWVDYSRMVNSVVIEEGVTYVGRAAFRQMYNLTSISIPGTVTSFGPSAFDNALRLKEVVIPEGVVELSNSMFLNCGELTSVTLPKSLRKIDARAFAGCPKLACPEIPKGVAVIGDEAFGYVFDDQPALYKLDSYPMQGYSNSAAEDYAKANDFAFTAIDVEASGELGDNLTWTLYKDGKLEIVGVGGMETNDSSSYAMYSAEEPQEGLSVREMANYASASDAPWADYSSSIRTVVIGSGVSNIGQNAFAGCSNLTAVSLPSSLTKIGNSAFYGCSSLTAVSLPAGLSEIGASAFSGCSSLKSVALPQALTKLSGSVFKDCAALASVEIPANIESIGINAFSGCTSLTSVVIPEGVKTIGASAFSGCETLNEVTLPESLEEIQSGAFSNIENLSVNYSGSLADWQQITTDGSIPGNMEFAKAELSAEVTPSNLKADDTAVISVIDSGNHVDNAVCTVISGTECVSVVGYEVTALKAGVAQILVQVPGCIGSTVVSVRVIDSDYNVHFGEAIDSDGDAVDLKKLDVSSAVRSWTIQLLNSDDDPADLSKFSFTSTDAKVAKLAVDKAGILTVTVPAGANGACTLSAVPKDKAHVKGAVSIPVIVRNYAPRLASAKLTMNSYINGGVSVAMEESYNNKILGDQIQVMETVNKQLVESEKFTASYKNGLLTIRTVAENVPNQTAKLRLIVPTKNEDESRVEYPFDVTLAVKNALPKVTVKQTVKPTLFDADSVGVLTVSAAGANVESMDFDIPGYNTWTNGDGTISVKPDGNEIQKKGTLTVKFTGYNTPYVKSGVAFASVNTKYSLTALPANATIHAAGSVRYAEFDLYDKTNKKNLDLTGCTVSANAGFAAEIVDGRVRLTASAEALAAVKKTANKVTLTVYNHSWNDSLTVPFTVTVIPASVQPVVKLKTAALTLNNKYPDINASTSFTVDMPNMTIDNMDVISDHADKFNVQRFDNDVVVGFANTNTADPGSYPLVLRFYSNGAACKDVKLTVKVISAEASASAKISGKLDMVQRDNVAAVTITLKNVPAGMLRNAVLEAPNAPTSAKVFDGSDKFQLIPTGYDAKGNPVAALQLKTGKDFDPKVTYKLRLRCVVSDGTENGSFDVDTADLSIKVPQGALKLGKVAAQTVYQCAEQKLIFTVNLASPIGAKLGIVEMNKLTTADFGSLMAAVGSVSSQIAPDGKSAEVTVTLRDTARLTAGKTYNLPLLVTAEGAAPGSAPAKLNLPLKVAK